MHTDLRTAHNLFVSSTGASSVVTYLSACMRGYEREVVPANVNTAGYTRGQIREAFKIYLGKTAPSTVICSDAHRGDRRQRPRTPDLGLSCVHHDVGALPLPDVHPHPKPVQPDPYRRL
ncbi:hypothetical protein [Streptomyces bobili]|uniref:hypothetical protein n=1 Tax=Streptomyces bobili TaxID=67280 RepID=UPI000A36005C|nr:hypothetical protein [Streptomyces bobili]